MLLTRSHFRLVARILLFCLVIVIGIPVLFLGHHMGNVGFQNWLLKTDMGCGAEEDLTPCARKAFPVGSALEPAIRFLQARSFRCHTFDDTKVSRKDMTLKKTNCVRKRYEGLYSGASQLLFVHDGQTIRGYDRAWGDIGNPEFQDDIP